GKTARPAGKPIAADALDKMREQLLGKDDGAAASAAKQLGDSGAPNAGGPLIEALAVGVRPGVTSAAIEALGRLKDPRSADVLDLYSGNRNFEVRVKAVKALAGMPGDRSAGILVD